MMQVVVFLVNFLVKPVLQIHNVQVKLKKILYILLIFNVILYIIYSMWVWSNEKKAC